MNRKLSRYCSIILIIFMFLDILSGFTIVVQAEATTLELKEQKASTNIPLSNEAVGGDESSDGVIEKGESSEEVEDEDESSEEIVEKDDSNEEKGESSEETQAEDESSEEIVGKDETNEEIVDEDVSSEETQGEDETDNSGLMTTITYQEVKYDKKNNDIINQINITDDDIITLTVAVGTDKENGGKLTLTIPAGFELVSGPGISSIETDSILTIIEFTDDEKQMFENYRWNQEDQIEIPGIGILPIQSGTLTYELKKEIIEFDIQFRVDRTLMNNAAFELTENFGGIDVTYLPKEGEEKKITTPSMMVTTGAMSLSVEDIMYSNVSNQSRIIDSTKEEETYLSITIGQTINGMSNTYADYFHNITVDIRLPKEVEVTPQTGYTITNTQEEDTTKVITIKTPSGHFSEGLVTFTDMVLLDFSSEHTTRNKSMENTYAIEVIDAGITNNWYESFLYTLNMKND